MNQDLVLCDSQHEQSGSIFGAQIQEQRGEASPTTTQKHTAIKKNNNNNTSFQIRIAKNARCCDSEIYCYLYLSGSGEDTGWLSIRLSCGDSCGRHKQNLVS